MFKAPSRRADTSADAAHPVVRPYLPIPVKLVVAYKNRPSVIGLYASIARLNVIKKDAVDVSRTDLARWCDTERDTLAGCIKRGIDNLEAGGWLLTERRTGEKTRLLAGWGMGAAERARPWRFDSINRARPKGLHWVTLPLDVLDLSLGRLQPHSNGPAEIDRYFNRALLSYHDIGLYILSQITDIDPPERLQVICLPTGVQGEKLEFPTLATLLERVAAGMVTFTDNDTAVCVRLSPAGSAQYQRQAGRKPSVFMVAGGSESDHAMPHAGSPSGSAAVSRFSAVASAETLITPQNSLSWDQDRINKTSKDHPSPYDSQTTRTTTTSDDQFEIHQEQFKRLSEITTEGTTCPTKPIPDTAACDENHILALDERVLQWHQALNPQRIIPHAERFALLHVQEQYGVEALKRWQFNASSAGRTFILPSYYQQCAATQACNVVRHHVAHRPALQTADQRSDMHQKTVLLAQVHPTLSTPLPALLDAEHTRLIAEIAHSTGCSIRRPEKLAHVSLDLLKRWRDIAHHPGLRARWQIGWVVKEISLNHEPPTLDELMRWAEEHGVSAYDPRLAPFRQAQRGEALSAADTVGSTTSGALVEAVGYADWQADTPPHRLSSVSTYATLWHAVGQALIQRADRSAHAVLRSLYVHDINATVVTVGIPQAAHKAIIEDSYVPLIRDLLSEYLGQAMHVRLVIAPPSAHLASLQVFQTAPPAPAWIAMPTWNQLHADLRALLADARLLDDGSLDVSEAAYLAICAQWADDVRQLVRTARPIDCGIDPLSWTP